MAGYRRFLPFINSSNFLRTRTCLVNSYQNASNKVLQKIEKSILPPKPKRPTTPFFEYLYTTRARIKEENPHITSQEIVKIAATEWSQLNTTQKKEYQTIYNEKYEIYAKELEKYNNSITSQQMDLVKQKQEEHNVNTKKLELKQKAKVLGKPTKPLSAYLLFIFGIRHKLPGKSLMSHLLNGKLEWDKLTSEEKKKYMEEAAKLMKEYKEEMRLWEEKMLQTGHTDVVSLKTRTEMQRKGKTVTK